MRARRPGPAWLAAIAALALAGCKPAPELEARPALWEVRGPHGSRGWLFGTVHALPRGVDWSTPALDRALAGADRLVLEIDPKGHDANAARRQFLRLGTTPGLPPLAERLPSDLRDELAQLVAAGGLDPAALAALEDWAAALTLAQAQAAREGLAARRGVEAGLRDRAQGQPVTGLESASAQFMVFDRLPREAQAALLAAVVAETGDAERGRRLLDAWARGDVATLARESERGMLENAILRRALLTTRNLAWTAEVEAMLRAGARPFVAVGAAHVVGDEGLPALLAARGWEVRRVQ